ncbi:unnamed protein product, partial [marine sediment metagenome]
MRSYVIVVGVACLSLLSFAYTCEAADCELIPEEIAPMHVAHDRAAADVYDGKLYVCTGYT